MWSKSSSPRQEHDPEQTQCCAHCVDWVQLTWTKDGQHHSTSQDCKNTCPCLFLEETQPHPCFPLGYAVEICFPLVSCYLVSLSLGGTQPPKRWWYMIFWEPWLTVLFIRPAQDNQNEIQEWPKDWERQLCLSSQKCWRLLYLTLEDRKFSSNFTAMNF